MNQPAAGFGNNMDLFSAMAPWGASAQSAPMTGGIDTSQMSPWEQYQMQSMDRQQELQGQQIDVMRSANAPQSGFAKAAGTFGTVANGVAALGNIYMGLKNMKLQKEAFKFNKGVTNTNLNNSIMDYNRRLADTLGNRALNNGQGSGWVSEQLAKYSATRSGG